MDGADVVGMFVVGACVVGTGLMQQMSLFFKQRRGFWGEVSGQVATQSPSRPSKLQLFRGERAQDREPADVKLSILGMPGVVDDVVVGAGVVGTGVCFSMQQISLSRKPLYGPTGIAAAMAMETSRTSRRVWIGM